MSPSASRIWVMASVQTFVFMLPLLLKAYTVLDVFCIRCLCLSWFYFVAFFRYGISHISNGGYVTCKYISWSRESDQAREKRLILWLVLYWKLFFDFLLYFLIYLFIIQKFGNDFEYIIYKLFNMLLGVNHLFLCCDFITNSYDLIIFLVLGTFELFFVNKRILLEHVRMSY